VIADAALKVVPKEQSGLAAGINDTFRQVGIAVGIAVWGAILVGRGADTVDELLAGTALARGARPRELIEAASSGNLDQVMAGLPAQAQQVVAHATAEGFITGLNDVLTLGALLSFGGAILVLWLVRRHEIDRDPAEAERAAQDVPNAVVSWREQVPEEGRLDT
jgi:hypothetical protein